MQEFLHTNNGHEFIVKYDIEDILLKVENSKKGFEKEYWTKNGVNYYDGVPESEYLTEDQFVLNIDKFIADIKAVINVDKFSILVNNFSKKKNGTFCKGRKSILAECNNSHYDCSHCGKWTYAAVVARTISDLCIEIEYEYISYQQTGF